MKSHLQEEKDPYNGPSKGGQSFVEVVDRYVSALMVLKADKPCVAKEAHQKDNRGNPVKVSLLKQDVALVTQRAYKIACYGQSKEMVHRWSSWASSSFIATFL
jgi:hypothetical protein